VVIDQVDVGDLAALELEDRPPVPEIDTDHCPARSPRKGWSRAPGKAMSDGIPNVESAKSSRVA
jgi:hypothetical protein